MPFPGLGVCKAYILRGAYWQAGELAWRAAHIRSRLLGSATGSERLCPCVRWGLQARSCWGVQRHLVFLADGELDCLHSSMGRCLSRLLFIPTEKCKTHSPACAMESWGSPHKDPTRVEQDVSRAMCRAAHVPHAMGSGKNSAVLPRSAWSEPALQQQTKQKPL